MSGGLDHLSVRSPRQRRRARRELQRAVDLLAAGAQHDRGAIHRVQPVVEVCAAEAYVAWRRARERSWRRERSDYNTQTWLERIAPMTIAAVWLPQSHTAQRRGRPAEIAMPLFSHGPAIAAAKDLEHPYEALVLRLAVAWVRVVLADPAGETAVLLAPPLIDLMTSRPRPRTPNKLGIIWPLEPSEPHINPTRQRA